MPDDGQNVLVVLADGSEILAYRQDGKWWIGVDYSSQDAELSAEVMFWREVS